MEDLNDKITGGTLLAPDWNQPASEIQNCIENTGQTLTNADLNQLGKAIAAYAAGGDFYTDSGAANAYVLSSIGLLQGPPFYFDGMRVRFIPDNDNTAASTVNVDGLGVKNITNTALANILQAGVPITLVYNIGSGEFDISGSPETSFESAGQTYNTGVVTYTFPHGLAAIPKLVQVNLVNLIADAGYAVGDIIVYGAGYGGNSANAGGFFPQIDSTNIVLRLTSTPSIYLPNKSTNVFAAITSLSWEFVVRAWA